jgi:hypothetical protein
MYQELKVYVFLTSAVDGVQWSASRPVCFIHRERNLDSHCIGSRVGLRGGLDAMEKRKPLAATGNRTWNININNNNNCRDCLLTKVTDGRLYDRDSSPGIFYDSSIKKPHP